MGGGSNLDYSFKESGAISMSGKFMFAAIILLFLTIIFIVFLHLYAKWFWRRNAAAAHTQNQSRRRLVFGTNDDSVLSPRRGLEPSVIRSLPVVVFHPSEFKDGLECAVCLCELSDGEKARLLPKCNHGFHLDCIDMWFHSHSTCPLCRNLVALESSVPELAGQEIRTPEANPADGHSTDSPHFPTNILFWGNQDQVSTGGSVPVEEDTSSSSASVKMEGNGTLVIDIPRQLTESSHSPSSSSVRFQEGELKSPPASTRLRSLKRLLSRDTRTIPCSPSGADVEQGGSVFCIKASLDS